MASKTTVYPTTRAKKNENGTANLGFEAKLWLAADKLRGNMDASEYKHVILGLIFLKYISDSFESRRQWLVREAADPKSEYFVKTIKLAVQLGATKDAATPAAVEQHDKQTRQQQAEEAIKQDSFVREAQAQLGAQVIENSIRPV